MRYGPNDLAQIRKLVADVRHAEPPLQAPPPAAAPIEALVPCGDYVAKIAKRVGAERLKRWWDNKTSGPCGGCEDRRIRMNAACATIEKWGRWLFGARNNG